MFKSFDCKCEERKKKPEDRNWVIISYKRTLFSNFTDGKPSPNSCIRCKACGKTGWTRAKYVDKLKIEANKK